MKKGKRLPKGVHGYSKEESGISCLDETSKAAARAAAWNLHAFDEMQIIKEFKRNGMIQKEKSSTE